MSHIIDFADARRRFETDDRSAIAHHERETDPENPDHAEHLIIGRTAECGAGQNPGPRGGAGKPPRQPRLRNELQPAAPLRRAVFRVRRNPAVSR